MEFLKSPKNTNATAAKKSNKLSFKNSIKHFGMYDGDEDNEKQTAKSTTQTDPIRKEKKRRRVNRH